MISIHPILRTFIAKHVLHPLLLFCLCFFLVITYGQSNTKEGVIGKNFAFANTASSPRQVIPFDNDWRFMLADNPAAKEVTFDDSQWRLINLPHDWSIEGPVNPPPSGDRNTGYFIHGIGWYRKSFLTSDTTKKIVVQFDGIYMNSDVWINGNFLGHRPYGFVNINYDITEYVNKDGKPNVLAVRVDDAAEPALRWYAGSGIYRHVRLITTGYTQFRLDGGVFVTTPEVSQQKATIKADYIIDPYFLTDTQRLAWSKDAWNVKTETKDVIVQSTVIAPDGKILTTTETKIAMPSMHPGKKVSQMITVTEPLLWSEKTPALYQLRSTLLLNNQKLDETLTTFGIRSLRFDKDKGFFVNEKPVKLKGVCVHQDAGSFGNAVPIAIWAYRLGLLKEMGCNAIRTSHNPFAPEFYDLCDKMGFYVFDEAFDEWTRDWTLNYTENTRGKSKFGYHLYFNQWYETDLRAMLYRDRNHPSVILYSIGNEIPDQFNDDGWKLAKKLVDMCHEEDSTRPVTSACDQSYVSSRNGFMDQLDIGGYNYLDRLYKDSTYVPERRRFPNRVFLGTETTHALHNWLGVRDNDYVIGDFIWTGIDYLGETGLLPNRGSNAGDIDIAGGKKSSFYQRAAYWQEAPVLQIFILTGEAPTNVWRTLPAKLSWNFIKDSIYTVRAATNCDEVELFLNNRSLGRKAISHNSYFDDWKIGYKPGELKAVGYLKGIQVIASKLMTTGEAAKLEIKQLNIPVTDDMMLFEINVTDKNGVPITDAKMPVTIKVQGDGEIIGVDNGQLDFAGPYKTNTRDAYNGRLLVTIQKVGHKKGITLRAESAGLDSSTFSKD
jgi:beta-galactosidase